MPTRYARVEITRRGTALKKLGVLVLGIISVLGAPAPGFSQWLKYPTADVPRKADGKPDLNAPTPRLPDGKPDFSGIWHASNPFRCNPNAGGFVACGTEIGGSPLGGNLGRNLPGGLPYKPEAATLAKERRADDSRDDPHVRCLPDNPPRHWTLPHLTKAVHTPKLLVLLYEVNAMYRQIFIDGRPLPEDPTPGWNGYSTARWEGDTLVVQSLGFKDQSWIDEWGTPGSDKLRLTERISRPDYGRLRIQMTVEDAKTFTRPFSFTVEQRLMPDNELIEFVCGENNTPATRLVGN